MAGEIMSKVAFSSKVPLLMKATSDSSQPTPGYLFEDIQKISYESIDYCIYMADFLIDRLKKKSLHVKLKVLQVIRYVVDRGHKEFTVYIRKNSNNIRELQGFNGPPDILHGDAFYVNIRNAATELLTILFDLERDQHFKSNGVVKSSSGFGISSPSSNSNIFSSIYDKVKEAIPSLLQTQPESQPVKENFYQQFNENPKVNCPSDTIWSFTGQQINEASSKRDNDSFGYQSPVPNPSFGYQPPVLNSHESLHTLHQENYSRETPQSPKIVKVSETNKNPDTTILTEVPDTLFQGLCVQERFKPNVSRGIDTTKCESQSDQSLLNNQFSSFMSNTQTIKNNVLNDDLEKNLFSSFNENNASNHINKSSNFENNIDKFLTLDSQIPSYNDNSFIFSKGVNQKHNYLESSSSLFKQSSEKQNTGSVEYLVSQTTYRAQLLQGIGNVSEKSPTSIQNQQQTEASKLKELDNFDPFSVEPSATNPAMKYATNSLHCQPQYQSSIQPQYQSSNPLVFQNFPTQRFPQQQQNNFQSPNSFHQLIQNPGYHGNYNNHVQLHTNEMIPSPFQNVTGFTQRPAVRLSNSQVKDSFSFVQDAMKSSMNK